LDLTICIHISGFLEGLDCEKRANLRSKELIID
jgi:hypothetical protein